MALGDNLLSATDLFKTYVMGSGDTENIVHALDGVSLAIHGGEMVAIRGPSGSGKTTLMNILGCLDRPTSGEYVLAGDDVSQMGDNALATARNKKIGFVFQTFNLLPRMNALENVELPLLYGGASNAKKKALEALTIVGLGERAHHKPNQLSGGQRQRVSIARAIVTDPAIVLADEPTGALDTRTGEEILALFKQLNSQGRTIIIVTHDLKVAGHCQREIYMRDGKVSAPDVVAIKPTEPISLDTTPRSPTPPPMARSVPDMTPADATQPSASKAEFANSYRTGVRWLVVGLVILVFAIAAAAVFLPAARGAASVAAALVCLVAFGIGLRLLKTGVRKVGQTMQDEMTNDARAPTIVLKIGGAFLVIGILIGELGPRFGAGENANLAMYGCVAIGVVFVLFGMIRWAFLKKD